MLKKTVIGIIISICILHGFLYAQSPEEKFPPECLIGKGNIMETHIGKFSKDELPQGKSIVNLLLNKQETSDKRKWLIFHFCDTLLWTRDDVNMAYGCFEHDNFRYDARQSLFMYTLCVNTDEKNATVNDTVFAYRNYKEAFNEVSYKDAATSFSLDAYIEEDLDINTLWW